MNIRELKTTEMNNAIAYVLGLIYPLYKEKNIMSNDCILGCINHNPGKITPETLDEHLRSVRGLLDAFDNTGEIELYDNKQYKVQSKIGFSILIEKNRVSMNECLDILNNKVEEVRKSSIDVQKSFIRGCFDGRSSWDTTAHYLALDVDRDYTRQDLIVSIVENTGINLNVNRREKNHPKNDQIRIKPDCLGYFLSYIGMFSTYRAQQVSDGLGLINKDYKNDAYETEKSLLATFREFDTINVEALNARFGISTTKGIMNILEKKQEFIEFEQGHFLNFKKLNMFGIDKEKLQEYCNHVFICMKEKSFFTAKQIMNEHISDEIDDLGFADKFYESIMKVDKRFYVSYIETVAVFSTKIEKISLTDIVVLYINECKMVAVDEMIRDLTEEYGIEMTRNLLMSRIKNTNIYYDNILDYVYKDYDTYYQDV